MSPRTTRRASAIARGTLLLGAPILLSTCAIAARAQSVPPSAAVRVNQMGYLPTARKVAVLCVLEGQPAKSFVVLDSANRRRFSGAARVTGAFGPCAQTARLDFSALTRAGRYRVVAGADSSPSFRISADVWRAAADVPLAYMREQRSGYNPFFHDSVHRKDGIVVDDSARAGKFVPVSGGWADASDYLQYVATSANATFVMLMAARDHPASFTDSHDAEGRDGANGVPDVLDEARHGLEWLLRMFPSDSELYNQLGDDRDHTYWDLPITDSSDYGWGKGGARPVYPCTGRPQGLFGARNRSTGLASTAGKYASAFALGAQLFARRDSVFADSLRRRALAAYSLGKAHPGVCQTAPGHAPYFYEEDNWVDDMELGAAELLALTRDAKYRRDALDFAAQEPVTPWMGADTARHYQWFPWHNNGHGELWRHANAADRARLAAYYRRGLDAVVRRAGNGFRVGIPFIWCSNDLMVSFASQAILYRRMTGDRRFVEYESAAVDWLFGANPWGTSMVIGMPARGVYPRDPHSVVAKELHVELTGGMIDGPVYRSIYQNLRGIALHDADEYAPWNTGFIVYHDDVGDYSTNEPIMDGSASLTWLLSAMAAGR